MMRVLGLLTLLGAPASAARFALFIHSEGGCAGAISATVEGPHAASIALVSLSPAVPSWRVDCGREGSGGNLTLCTGGRPGIGGESGGCAHPLPFANGACVGGSYSVTCRPPAVALLPPGSCALSLYDTPGCERGEGRGRPPASGTTSTALRITAPAYGCVPTANGSSWLLAPAGTSGAAVVTPCADRACGACGPPVTYAPLGLCIDAWPTDVQPRGSSTAAACGVPAPTPPSPRPSTPAQRVVYVEDFAFEPSTLTIGTGTRVLWVNRGLVEHTTTADEGQAEAWASRPLAPRKSTGDAFSRVFDSPGTYSYHCSLHPTLMRGVVTVV